MPIIGYPQGRREGKVGGGWGGGCISRPFYGDLKGDLICLPRRGKGEIREVYNFLVPYHEGKIGTIIVKQEAML